MPYLVIGLFELQVDSRHNAYLKMCDDVEHMYSVDATIRQYIDSIVEIITDVANYVLSKLNNKIENNRQGIIYLTTLINDRFRNCYPYPNMMEHYLGELNNGELPEWLTYKLEHIDI